MSNEKKLWEILVPTQMVGTKGLRPIRTRYHRIWDERVRAISGGLSIQKPIKGHYISQETRLIIERMIPVRIIATRVEIMNIATMSCNYYNQEAILCYQISNEVIMIKRIPKEKQIKSESCCKSGSCCKSSNSKNSRGIKP